MYSLKFLINFLDHRLGTFSESLNNSFMLDFKHNIISNNIEHPEFRLIEKYRSELCNNNQPLEIFDQGAGTKSGCKQKTVGSMTRVASVSPKYGQLLYRLAGYYKPSLIIELGTALGISTMYLAMGNPKCRVITVEGNCQLAGIALENFAACNLKNITLMNSSFDDALVRLVPECGTRNLIFIDGNHTFKATLQYFETFMNMAGSSNIFVFDDINWSYDMMRAWKSINGSAASGLVVDLFQMGILFQGQGNGNHKFRVRY